MSGHGLLIEVKTKMRVQLTPGEMRVVLEYTLAIFPRLALFAYILSAVGHLLTTIASSFLGSSKCILSVK